MSAIRRTRIGRGDERTIFPMASTVWILSSVWAIYLVVVDGWRRGEVFSCALAWPGVRSANVEILWLGTIVKPNNGWTGLAPKGFLCTDCMQVLYIRVY